MTQIKEHGTESAKRPVFRARAGVVQERARVYRRLQREYLAGVLNEEEFHLELLAMEAYLPTPVGDEDERGEGGVA